MKSVGAGGFVECNGEIRRYQPSVRWSFVGNWVLGSTDVNARLHTLAQRLHDEAGETVLIGS